MADQGAASDYPKISIITPSYNQGQFIEETILSILNQNYPNLEHIVMDGGSKDNTVEILKKYEHTFAYWQSEKDKGHTNALNQGMKKVTGDIVAVLNSDDVYLPGALHFAANQFRHDPNLRWMTAPSLYWGYGEDHPYWDWVMTPEVPEDKQGWLVKQTIPHPSTFIKREVHEKFGEFDEGMYFGMDYEYWCRLAFGGEKLVAFKRPLSGFRLHEASKSVAEGDRRDADIRKIFDKYSAQLPESQRKALLARHEAYWLSEKIYKSLWPLREGHPEEAKRLWQEAVGGNPKAKMTKAYWTTLMRIKLNKPS